MYYLIFLLLLFPKGGFKLGGVPVTWSYLGIGLAAILALFSPLRIQKKSLQALFFLIPLQVVSIFSFLINGVDSVEFTVAFLIVFFVLPLIFYLLLPIDPSSLVLVIRRAVLTVALYGIALFSYHLLTGNFFEIPFLTTNFHDVGELSEKCNLRSSTGMVKLFSTYNNGNVYGICMLLLLPIFCSSENSFWKRAVVKASLVLTLSRTIWIGLLIHEIFFSVFVQKKWRGAAVRVAIALCAIAVTVCYIGFSWRFICDATLGGRIELLDVLSEMSLFMTKPFEGISEIAYLGAVSAFGLIGFLAFILALIGPIALSFFVQHSLSVPIRCGLCNYLILSCSDGATLYIPVMAIFWLLSATSVLEKVLPEKAC